MKIYHRGTEINKIENEWWNNCISNDVTGLFESDFIYVSNGFQLAVENGRNPIEVVQSANCYSEWHHIFYKDADGDFRAEKVRFA